MAELEAAGEQGVAAAAPPDSPSHTVGVCSGESLGLSGAEDYVGRLSPETRVELFEVARLLAGIARREGLKPADVRRSGGKARVGELLALTQLRRPRLSTLYRLADEWEVPRDVMDDIARWNPNAIAPEREPKS